MAEQPDKTLTAQLSPLRGTDVAATPLLLLAARAGHAPLLARDRFLLPGSRLLLARRAAGVGAVTPGAWGLDDPLASSRHAEIVREGEAWSIADLGSKNGTFVDGVALVAGAPPRRLNDGAIIFLGDHVLVFRLATAAQVAAVKLELGDPLGPVPTASPRMAALCDRLRRLAVSDAEVLLCGETGVGKEVYARALHERSRRPGRFVALNCAAIPRELIESELFGYRPGAHSTAHAGKPGLIESAEGGTLFLDEIAEVNVETQVKLLRFLQDKQLTPLGSTRPRTIDVRIVAATNREVAPGSAGGLRDDLLGRLGAAPIRLPPLRDRLEDVGALAAFFLARVGQKNAGTPAGFDGPALRALALARFPLNVRELEKIVVAAAALAEQGRLIGVNDLPETVTHPPAPSTPGPGAGSRTAGASLAAGAGAEAPRLGRKPPEPAPEAAELERLLRQYHGNVAEVARAVGRQRAAVWRWIKRYGLAPEQFRAD